MRRSTRQLGWVVGVGVAAAALVACATTPSVADGEARQRGTTQGWGRPAWHDEFNGSRLQRTWGVFDSLGNAGNGVRSPSQVGVGGGVLTLTGTPSALTGGIALDRHVHRFGRWSVRMRTSASGAGAAYHAVLALIPHDTAAYHCGATDIDFAEFDLGAPVGFYLHALPNRQHYSTRRSDTTQWHTYSVEVAPRHVTWFVDGRAVVTDRDATMIAGVPFALDVQLDAFQPGGLAPSVLQVDWARYYPLRGRATPRAPAPKRTTYDYAC